MPNHFLLTGAGFSRNWGGFLGDEAFEYLLAQPEITEALRRELWISKNNGEGFEGTLARLQAAYDQSKDTRTRGLVDALQGAILGMFNAMDQAFQRRPFEPQNDVAYMVSTFLRRFAAIFTLNQDLLLERHYAPNALNMTSPGIGAPAQQPYFDPNLQIGAPRSPTAPPYNFGAQSQPYFKLHGSQNWVSAEGERLLIMGGNKPRNITRFPILQWYDQVFGEHLMRGDARLMIIGYRFGDAHINQHILNAAKNGLKMFIVDPLGVDLIDKRPKIPLRERSTELMDILQPQIIGASRRPLLETFDTDRVEFAKIIQFFGA